MAGRVQVKGLTGKMRRCAAAAAVPTRSAREFDSVDLEFARLESKYETRVQERVIVGVRDADPDRVLASQWREPDAAAHSKKTVHQLNLEAGRSEILLIANAEEAVASPV